MTPLEIFNEEAAEFVREWLNVHWRVWWLLGGTIATFAAGYFIGKQN